MNRCKYKWWIRRNLFLQTQVHCSWRLSYWGNVLVKECIIHAHVQALLFLHVPLCKNVKYTVQLWKLRDEVVKHTRSLETLEQLSAESNVGYCLPPWSCHVYRRSCVMECSKDSEGHESDLKRLLKWLQKDIEILERKTNVYSKPNYEIWRLENKKNENVNMKEESFLL